MRIDDTLTADALLPRIRRMWELSAVKIRSIDEEYDRSQGSPVFTVEGRYTTRGWTEWTEGFQYGSAFLQFDATGDQLFLDLATRQTVERMAKHLTHFGVHDHGFNNVSTYGALLRLMGEGRVANDPWKRRFCELALRVSGAVQARRWTPLPDGLGYIPSFNGPHSLFADTIRSLRSLALSHLLGHTLMGENDRAVSLLERLILHARTTAKYNVYYGTGRDSYDLRGRVAHESVFNVNDGAYRCPNTQQGYSPFTTWTRGLAWIMCGYAEELEFLEQVPEAELAPFGGRSEVESFMTEAVRATCDFFILNTAADGVPYWDTGAPGLARMGDYLNRPADPYNEHEPVDSSAAAIGAQGLLRLGHLLTGRGDSHGRRYTQAGLTALQTLLSDAYLADDAGHQGLLLHSVYHRPNGWDYVPPARTVPSGESSMWGDYHLRELALYVQRLAEGGPYLTFFGGVRSVDATHHNERSSI